jgi:hypothetical protein
MKKEYGKGEEAINARKAASKKEFERKQKLKRNLSKLLKQEGYKETPKPKNPIQSNPNPKPNPKPNPYQKEEEKIKKIKIEKENEKKEKIKNIEDKQENFKMQQLKRRGTNINLSKRTKKGQPVMSHQINHLLEKIKANKH